jgi:hypothetical protein
MQGQIRATAVQNAQIQIKKVFCAAFFQKAVSCFALQSYLEACSDI